MLVGTVCLFVAPLCWTAGLSLTPCLLCRCQVVIIFRYIRDKDVFESFYKSHLQKRLLGNRSLSSDMERSMITKLKVSIAVALPPPLPPRRASCVQGWVLFTHVPLAWLRPLSALPPACGAWVHVLLTRPRNSVCDGGCRRSVGSSSHRSLRVCSQT
jgi:hypothetical protein